MENAKLLWERLGLPSLKPQMPWYGYSLGDWSQEWDRNAEQATRGEWMNRDASYQGDPSSWRPPAKHGSVIGYGRGDRAHRTGLLLAAAIGRRHRESHGGTVAGFVRHRRWGRAALEAIAEGIDRLGKSQDGSSACDDASRNDAPRSDGLPQNKARN